MTQQQILAAYNREKLLKLIAVIAIDSLGMLSYVLPVLGEISDVFIAPVSALLLFAVFKSTRISALGFAEELIPFTDIIPTGTIFWIRRYVKNGKETFEKFVQEKVAQQSILDNAFKS